MQARRDRATWRRADVEDPREWTHVLGEAEQRDLAHTTARLREAPLASLTPEQLPRSGPLFDSAMRWRDALRDGVGFARVRGFPLDRLEPGDVERAYVVLGLFFGPLVPQNLKGELLTHVRDTGADPSSPATRLYTTRAEQDFHTDGADVIGLLCLRPARSGGVSRLASSSAIVDAIATRRPDLHRVLFEDFPWHYQEPGNAPIWFSRPICTLKPGARGPRLNTFFIPWYLRRSQELPDAPRMSAPQLEAIALVESLANDETFHLDMSFEPGDVQWLKNAAILHKRTAYDDDDAPERKRHLIRLWMSAPDFEDGDAQLRRGVVEESAR